MRATLTAQSAPNLFVDLDQGRVVYRRLGASAGVPLVLLQRFRGNLDDWDPALVNRLAERRQVVLFDDCGVGLSTGVPAATVAELSHRAQSFIGALQLGRVDLLGYSLGGFVAQQVALERPSLVRKLVLAGTAPKGGEGFAPFRVDVDAAARHDHPGLDELLTIFFPNTETSRATVGPYVGRLQERTTDRDDIASLAVRDAQLAAIGGWGTETSANRLSEIRQPALVANGNADAMIPIRNSYALQEGLFNAHLIVYPDSGHGFIYQHAEWFAKHVELFLGE